MKYFHINRISFAIYLFIVLNRVYSQAPEATQADNETKHQYIFSTQVANVDFSDVDNSNKNNIVFSINRPIYSNGFGISLGYYSQLTSLRYPSSMESILMLAPNYTFGTRYIKTKLGIGFAKIFNPDFFPFFILPKGSIYLGDSKRSYFEFSFADDDFISIFCAKYNYIFDNKKIEWSIGWAKTFDGFDHFRGSIDYLGFSKYILKFDFMNSFTNKTRPAWMAGLGYRL